MAKNKPASREVTFTDLYDEPKWDASELDFSDEEWVCPAVDAKGHSVRESFRVPPTLHRAVEILVASKRFPYKTTGDFFRHAVYRHAFFCHRRAQDVPRHLIMACEAIAEQMRDEQTVLAIRNAIETAVKTCSMHAADGNTRAVIRIVAQVKSQIDAIPKESAWRKRFLTEFRDKLAGFARVLRETADGPASYRPATYSSSGLPPQIDPDQLDYEN